MRFVFVGGTGGSGFRVWGFRALQLRFGAFGVVLDLRLGAYGFNFRVQALGFEASCLKVRVDSHHGSCLRKGFQAPATEAEMGSWRGSYEDMIFVCLTFYDEVLRMASISAAF